METYVVQDETVKRDLTITGVRSSEVLQRSIQKLFIVCRCRLIT